MKYRNCFIHCFFIYSPRRHVLPNEIIIDNINKKFHLSHKQKITVIYEQQPHEFSCLGPISRPRSIKPFIFCSYTSYLQLLTYSYIHIHTKTEIKLIRKLFEQWNPDHWKQNMRNFGKAKFTVLRLNLSNTMLLKCALQRASNHIMLLIKFEKYM